MCNAEDKLGTMQKIKDRLDAVQNTDDKLDTMRLLIEGAINIYEWDGMRLQLLAQQEHDLKAQIAYESIGRALYDLSAIICDMQEQQREKDTWLENLENED